MAQAPVILWFRQDLRLQDNEALKAALATGSPIIPLYLWDVESAGDWPIGAAARWWLHHSLKALGESLRSRGTQLLLLQGKAETVVPALARETGAVAVYWNCCYEPAAIERDNRVAAALTSAGVEVKSHRSALLFEPDAVVNKQGKPFQVFTPYWRYCLTLPVPSPVSLSKRDVFQPPDAWPKAVTLEKLGLLPALGWASEFGKVWTPGETGAHDALRRFLADRAGVYDEEREIPSRRGTSHLSPHLHFGEISPRQIWAEVRRLSESSGIFPLNRGLQRFLEELGWREFAHHLLYHFPNTPTQPLRTQFRGFSWANDPDGSRLRAWQRGRTGYPIVDAGMRELWSTGWMHNRVRMIVASFLVKHLRLPWTEGAAWFWDTLVDADLANNTMGWQWSAGCGADAAPYFRIFAPVKQGERFDPDGAYVKRWLPELAGLPAAYVHCPWEASPLFLDAAGVVLGESYPMPIVEHSEARAEALAAFASLKELRA